MKRRTVITNTQIAIRDDVALIHGSIGQLKNCLEAGLETDAKKIMVFFDGRRLGEDEINRVAKLDSDVVFVTTRGAYTNILGGFLKFVYNLKTPYSVLCSAVCFSKKAAYEAVSSNREGVKILMDYGDSASTIRVDAKGHHSKTSLRALLNLLPFNPLDSTLLRFLIVGVSGVAVNALILSAQVALLGLKPYLAVPLAFEASVASNFTLNDKFTFHGSKGRLVRLIKYNFSSMGSFLTQFASVYAFTSYLHVHYLLASFVGIGLGFLLNYTLSLKIW
jgi:putative flippase GtrA